MEERNEQHVHEQDDDHSGTWVLITTGPGRVAGKVWGLDLVPVSESHAGKDIPVESVLKARVITLMPTYDFFAPLRQFQTRGPDGQPAIGMTRDPLITARDFTSRPYKTHVNNGPGVLLDFFSQMHPDDRKIYEGFIAQARAHAKSKYEEMTKEQPPGGSRIALAKDEDVAAVVRTHGRQR
jgi:hypothetical protein